MYPDCERGWFVSWIGETEGSEPVMSIIVVGFRGPFTSRHEI